MSRIIAIEGIDGSGKGTQSRLLAAFCRRVGISHELFSFPRYRDTFFGREVGRYLDGKYGSLNVVDPRMAALLYAGDRYETRELLLDARSRVELVICDRYTPSNLAHQGAKAKTSGERRGLIKWIETLEYEVLEIPRADEVVFLDIDLATSTQLVSRKKRRSYTKKKKDLHEENDVYLTAVQNVYRRLVPNRQWRRVACCDLFGRLRDPKDISLEVRKQLGLS